MLGLIKITWVRFIYIILGLIIGLILSYFLIILPSYVNICESYYEDEFKCQEAIEYDVLRKVCICEDGEYPLDNNLINKKNSRIRNKYQVGIDQKTIEKYQELSKKINQMNLTPINVSN